jgi:predicted TIM-barrel fold metal-dependent hydrolase
MDDLGIATAILSVPRPGFFFGDRDAARAMAREMNEYGADLVRERPDRFGLFASLPLPAVEEAAEEVRFAFDELDCDGAIMLANYDGLYLGDSALDPVMAELNDREAVVFVHPNAPPTEPVAGVPVFVVDFLLDTTRAALNLVRNGVLRRFPQIRFLLAHGGGFLPYASHRIAVLTPEAEEGPKGREEFLNDCSHFYFDTALTASPHSLPSLLAFARPGRIVYGSDWPYASSQMASYFADQLVAADLDPDARSSIERGALESLLPRLGGRN